MSWCIECRKDDGFCIYCQKQFKHLHGHIQRMHEGTIRAETCPIKTYGEWLTKRQDDELTEQARAFSMREET